MLYHPLRIFLTFDLFNLTSKVECWAALGGGYTAGPVSSIVYCEE